MVLLPVLPVTSCPCEASIVKPDTGLVDALSVILLSPLLVFVNTPVAVPAALKPSDIFVISPVIDWLAAANVPSP